MIKPIVFVPMERSWANADQLLPGFVQIAQSGVPFLWLPYSRTDVSRNKAAEELLRSDFTHIVMLDSDQRHPPDIVRRLAQHIIEDPARLIVGGLYYRRGEPYNPLAWRLGEDDKLYQIGDHETGLIEVDLIGTGALMISRAVFEQLPRPWFWYSYEGIETPGFSWPTEDIQFCALARNAGISIYCDTTIESPHLSTAWINRGTYLSYRAMAEAKIEQG